MPTRKIDDLKPWVQQCNDPEHNPPSYWCPSPGIYEHECPSCGKKQIVVINQRPTMSAVKCAC